MVGCERLSLTCTYDERQWAFIAQHSTGSSSTSRANSSILETSDPGPQTAPTAAYQRSLDRTILEIEIDEIFWTTYMPTNDPGRSSIIDGVVSLPWVPTVRALAGRESTTRLALDACGFLAIGNWREDGRLLQQGLMLYSQALHEANKALRNPVRAQSDDVLATVRILGMCEMFRGDGAREAKVTSQGTDWLRHVEGTEKLLEWRGPESCSAEHGHALFVDCRIYAAVSGMTRRRSSLLSTARWASIPWAISRRTIQDKLMDLMIVIGGLLNLHDNLKSPSSDCNISALQQQCREIMTYTVHLNHQLQAWQQSVLELCVGSGDLAAAAPLATLADVCMNHGYGFFQLIMQYWSIHLVLHSTTWLMLRWMAQSDIPSTTLAEFVRANPTPDPQPYAACIANHCHHYFRPEAGFYGTQHASWPMAATFHYYAATGQTDSPEFQTIRRVLRGMKSARFTSAFLVSIANHPAPPQLKGDARNTQELVEMAKHWWGVDKADDRAS
ncbi:hypothetical protein LTS09_009024 [Friedmanniomyces endolithicus]|nr:hypothetical protein LTS09_009024 [Friedmanniomyces endolithicus]